MKNHPLIKLIINILSNNSTRFFESYIKDFKLNLNNFFIHLSAEGGISDGPATGNIRVVVDDNCGSSGGGGGR